MDKSKLRSFVSLLIERVDNLGRANIWERSTDIRQDLEHHEEDIEAYKSKMEKLLR